MKLMHTMVMLSVVMTTPALAAGPTFSCSKVLAGSIEALICQDPALAALDRQLAEVYAAGETPLVAADGRSLARALRVMGKVEPVFVEDIAAMPQTILDVARAGDVVLTMGAGSIGAVPGKLVEMQ